MLGDPEWELWWYPPQCWMRLPAVIHEVLGTT